MEPSQHLFRPAAPRDPLPELPATPSRSSLGDALHRFARNKASVVAVVIIGILLLFALLTPTIEFAGPTRFRYYQFWTQHLSIYVTLFYLMFVHQMRPTIRSAVKSYIALFVMVIVASCANAYLGGETNYLFLAKLPDLLSFVPSFFVLRIGIMAAVVTAMYALAYLPWYIIDKKRAKKTDH